MPKLTAAKLIGRLPAGVLTLLLFAAAAPAQYPQLPLGNEPPAGDQPLAAPSFGAAEVGGPEASNRNAAPIDRGPALGGPAISAPSLDGPTMGGPATGGPTLPQRGRSPADPSTFAAPDRAETDDAAAEELAAPDAERASQTTARQEVTVLQPTGAYAGATWLPDANLQAGGWMREIDVPPGLIDCTCEGQLPGPRRPVWRSLNKPTSPQIDPRCVVCVKEPYLDYETVTEEHRVVIHRCFESSEPFKHRGCEAGHCYEAKGTTTLRKLHTCEAKVPVKYLKPVVRYRDVYYYIPCKEDQGAM